MGRLTDSLLVVDAHCDTLIRRQNKSDPVDLTPADPSYQIDLPRLRAGGVDCLFCMVGDRDLDASVSLIDAVYRMCGDPGGEYALCRSASDVRRARAAGQLAIVMTIEGQVMFRERLGHLRTWHRLGVRIASLTHGDGRPPELQYSDSYFGYITPAERETLRRQSKGLTPFARDALAEMARLAMPVDLAHCNDAAFWEVLEVAAGPVCYTHGAAYALCPHSRLLTDDMMRALAERGGVMGHRVLRRLHRPGSADPGAARGPRSARARRDGIRPRGHRLRLRRPADVERGDPRGRVAPRRPVPGAGPTWRGPRNAGEDRRRKLPPPAGPVKQSRV